MLWITNVNFYYPTHPGVPRGGREVLSMALDDWDLWKPPPPPPPGGTLGTAGREGSGPSDSDPEGEDVRGSKRGAEIGLGG